MSARVFVVMAVVALVLVPGRDVAWSQAAAAKTPAGATKTASGSQVRRTGSRTASGATTGAARASEKASRTGSRATPGATAGGASASRRLEDIPIEGEIAVPQVLFITARDQRRFVDFQHRRYLRTSLQVGETTRFPSWIAVVPGPKPEDNRKETSR